MSRQKNRILLHKNEELKERVRVAQENSEYDRILRGDKMRRFAICTLM